MNENLMLVRPSMDFADDIIAYRREFFDYGELSNNKQMYGGQGLERFDNPADWIEYCELLENPKTVPVRGFVDASQYMLLRKNDGKILGLVNIRHRLNANLEMDGGHIGYSIRPSERHSGYAKQILARGLEKCRELGIKSVLITCKASNEGSRKTIIANGGKLERSIFYDGEQREHYRII